MMNNDVSRAPAAPEKEKLWKRALKRIKKTLTHNLGWKIASLVLAICLWGGLITQDTSLPRDKVIDGVRVTVVNATNVRSNGLVVVSGLDEGLTVRVRARVPQRYYSAVTAANYSARLDLSQIQGTGEQTLKITASSTNATMYGTVTEIFNPEITVEVEAYATQNRVPVEVRTTGEVPEGYYPAALTYSPQYVDIGGPKDIVEAAVRCVAVFDQSSLSTSRNPNTMNVDFTLEDAEGNALDGSNLTVTSAGQTSALQRIAVSQYVYTMAQVPIDTEFLIRGEPAEGYAVTNVEIIPAAVTIAGREAVIAPYLQEGTVLFPYEQIDVSNRRQSVSTFLALRTPTNMEYVSNNVVQVRVTIEPLPADEPIGEAEQP
ncbi:MAG: hypothetical protein IJ662_12890 [Clostridia bacterium]|nr:hypothetical protein [Clostridia bacterium]